MLQKTGNIIIALCLLIASSGLLVNKHFSGNRHYSSAFFISAEPCCNSTSTEEKHNSCTQKESFSEYEHCFDNKVESQCCMLYPRQNTGHNNYWFESEDCCYNESSFIQLSEIFFSEKGVKKIFIPQNYTFTLLNTFYDQLFFKTLKSDFSDNSPPILNSIPIRIEISCFRC
ncbi:MAG: hypothetical protein U9R19_06240 [Bacteroidota bacterium]|nr:hypothetical protein [Bacteroidota bacterium]